MNEQNINSKKARLGRPITKIVTGDAKNRGEKFKIRRQEMGYTQSELAELLTEGIDDDDITIRVYTISGWENGTKHKELSDDYIDLIHEIMDVSKEYFDEPLPEEESSTVHIIEKDNNKTIIPSYPPPREKIRESRVVRSYPPIRKNVHRLQMIPISDHVTVQHLTKRGEYEVLNIRRDTCSDLRNLEQRSYEELWEISDEYIRKFRLMYSSMPKNSQILFYSMAQRTSKGDNVTKTIHERNMLVRFTPIILEILGNVSKEPQDIYWIKEFKHLKHQLDEQIEDIIKCNDTSMLYVFALAPQPLVVELGRLLANVPNMEILIPDREDITGIKWETGRPYEIFNYKAHNAKTIKDIVVLNLSLNTSIKKTMIKRVLGSELSIWELSMKKFCNDYLKSKNQLIDFKVSFRDILDRIMSKHNNCKLLHVFLSVPIPIAFEIGRVWKPDSDPDLKLYGLSSESGDYYPIHTISKD